MNAYDFDGTIYNGDSGADFVRFVFFKKPLYMTGHLIKSSVIFAKYKFGKLTFKEMKESLFSFIKCIDNLNEYVNEFAEKNKNKVKKYYEKNRQDDDVIVSASLDFYLLPLCKKIGINNVICTNYDIEDCKIINENCKGAEKVKRFETIYGAETIIENAYGDSRGDFELLKRAQNGFIIKGEDITAFNEEKWKKLENNTNK